MATTFQTWRHKISGELYAVAFERDELFAASGPLHYSEAEAALAGNFDDDPEVREWLVAEEGFDAFNLDRTGVER
jgi:hypothetical protein